MKKCQSNTNKRYIISLLKFISILLTYYNKNITILVLLILEIIMLIITNDD